ncbi:SKP1 component [Theobroma cacao]|nr:SKP1 component [Theobroma cacao]
MSSSNNSGKVLKLKSKDNQIFEVEESVAIQSELIKNMVEAGCDIGVIPLLMVHSKTLRNVIEWCQKHVDYVEENDNESNEEEVKNWESEICEEENNNGSDEEEIRNWESEICEEENYNGSDEEEIRNWESEICEEENNGSDEEEIKNWESEENNDGSDKEEVKNWESEDNNAGSDNDELKNWESKFVDIDKDSLYELLLAADYLNIDSLLDRVIKQVADMIKASRSVEEVRQTFGIKSDFTPEEEEEILAFVTKCSRDHIVSKSGCVFQRKIVAADILPSMTLRDTINRNLNQSGSRNSDNGGASFSIQDTASKADQKTEIIVPPQHTSEKVKQPTPKGSVPACGKRRATEEGNFGCDGTEKEEEGLHGAKLPTVANLPICWS